MERKNIIIAAVILVLLVVGGVAAFKMAGNSDSDDTSEQQSDAPKGKMAGDICTYEYAPVCGVDGITYGNKCMAGSMEIAHEGECGAGAAGGTYPAGEVPSNATDEELASS